MVSGDSLENTQDSVSSWMMHLYHKIRFCFSALVFPHVVVSRGMIVFYHDCTSYVNGNYIVVGFCCESLNQSHQVVSILYYCVTFLLEPIFGICDETYIP